MADSWHQGRVASAGIAIGAAFPMPGAPTEPPTASSRQVAAPAAEAAALRRAIAAAIDDIGKLMAAAKDDAADILEFQVAMLEDDALSEPALATIEAGEAADFAWHTTLDAQIADYASSDDDYFRARTADLRDMRDRVLRHLRGETAIVVPPGAIFLGEDLTPSLFLSQDWSNGGGIALSKGSSSSHVAMLARMRGVPMVVGLGFDVMSIEAGVTIAVDAEGGRIVIAPTPETRNKIEARRAEFGAELALSEQYRLRPARTADGIGIKLLINIAGLADLDHLDPAVCDGIGLVRTEFLFRQDGNLPDENEQYHIYSRMVEWAQERPVTIRTLDAGGDKPIAGLTLPETNPFLGLRGLRLSLARTDVFKIQLRALCRAAFHGDLKIMLPMVSVPAEVEAARRLLDEVIGELQSQDVPHRRPPLGIMVEVPSAALMPERFSADFYSIGSNDLTQYTLAAARDLDSVAALVDAGDPAVLKLIANTAAHGRHSGVEVSLCGDAAAETRLVPQLLAAGLRSLSVAPAAVGRVKAAVASIRLA
ncbi:MAG TPA: phosphoenolpyruvate--protein phosphotransferase [Dongiaceae bacterium]|nr:phosphoenolpyruvate--protein phosphotransferase [Dongiaceae bacterium]